MADAGVMPDDQLPSSYNRLAARIVTSSLVALVVVVSMVCWTLWLSWQLEGAGAAINDTGSLRMRAHRVAVQLIQPDEKRAQMVRAETRSQDAMLTSLREGNPARPLFLPASPDIRTQMRIVTDTWRDRLQPAALRGIDGEGPAEYLRLLPLFVQEANTLVRMIERDNAWKTSLLRLSQAVLLVIAFVGTLAMIYLLYLWIIAPVLRLQEGLQRMAAREFSTRLPVNGRDEFGMLARGFNRMADELEGVYRSLEARVHEKTAQLEAQNRELGALYDMAAFLNQPNDIDQMCRGFLQRVMRQFDADGGSVRALDPLGGNLNLMVSEGLTETLEDAEHCMKVDACFCGTATRQGVVVVRDFRMMPLGDSFQCAKDGFRSLAVFRIVTHDNVLGSFSLHFRRARELPVAESQLLETLGQHLGVALDNCRLSAKARQLAVVQERNLVAQGLHDSIAQGLNFLNLQAQMLDEAMVRGDLDEAREIVPLLHTGIDESYQDVRELLVNFRTKLGQGDLAAAVEDTVARFRRQSGLEATLTVQEGEGAPLPPEQQLQVLFVLQEALSNIRKHAEASRVVVVINNGRDFELSVTDDGAGYDPAEVAGRAEGHIGLHIMHERAARLSATLTLTSAPGAGARVSLLLPRSERQTA